MAVRRATPAAAKPGKDIFSEKICRKRAMANTLNQKADSETPIAKGLRQKALAKEFKAKTAAKDRGYRLYLGSP
jgi:hypothetical protein